MKTKESEADRERSKLNRFANEKFKILVCAHAWKTKKAV